MEEKSCRASPSRNSNMEEERGGERWWLGLGAPPAPSPLYIGGVRPGLPWPLLQALWPAAKRGKGGKLPPQVDPPLGFGETLRGGRPGPLGLGAPGPLGQGSTPSAHVGPPRSWAPWWTPPEPSRTFPVFHRKNPELFRNLEINFPYMNLILRTILDLLVMSWIPSETPNKLRSPSHIPNLLMRHRTLSASPYGL